MRVKKELTNYRSTVSEIIDKEREIEELRDEIIELSGPSYDITGSRAKGYMQSSLENQIIKYEKNVNEKNREIKRLKRKLDAIDSLILTLDAEEKIIIVGFFLEGKTNRKICIEVDEYRGTIKENEKYTIEALKKRKARIIKKMQKRYDIRIKNI